MSMTIVCHEPSAIQFHGHSYPAMLAGCGQKVCMILLYASALYATRR